MQKLKPLLGRMDWALQAPDYDYRQEIARAAFADMLHDQERVRGGKELGAFTGSLLNDATFYVFAWFVSSQNRLYYEGLRAAIAKKRREGQRVDVLDIGTGTGLLAMMAARLGADSVTAIEVEKINDDARKHYLIYYLIKSSLKILFNCCGH